MAKSEAVESWTEAGQGLDPREQRVALGDMNGEGMIWTDCT